MANLTLEQNSLHGGEISPLLYGRRDLPLYANALARCRNALPLVTGGVTNRPGSRLLATNIIFEDIPYKIPTAFYHTLTLQGIATRYIIAITEKGNGFGFPTSFVLAVFSLDGVQRAAFLLPHLAGNGPGQIGPHVDVEKEISWASLDNILYLAHYQMPPQQLARGATNDDWTLSDFAFTKQPTFRPAGTEAHTLTPFTGLTIASSAVSGTVTLTASKELFVEEMIGKVLTFRGGTATITACNINGLTATATVTSNFAEITASATWTIDTLSGASTVHLKSNNSDTFSESHEHESFYLHGAEVQIYGIVDNAGIAIGTLVGTLSASTETLEWTVNAWFQLYGYPKLVCAADQRLIFAASPANPTTIWGSRINSYGDFLVGDATADAPWSYSLSSTRTALRRLLVFDSLLTLSGDALLSVSGTGSKIPTATDVRSTVRLAEGGSNYVDPVLFGSDLLVVPDDGLRVLQVEYSLDVDKFVTVDLIQHARHLLTAPIASLAVSRVPHPMIWLALKDGALLSCTYDPVNQVIAWARHDRSPAPSSGELVRTVLAVPQEDGIDRVYLISGLGLEELTPGLYLDAVPVLTVDGTTASGLTSLAATSVQVLIAGVPQGLQTVSAEGTITVPAGTLAENLQAGLPIAVQVKPLPPPLQASTGHATRSLKDLILLHETQTLTVDGTALPFYPDDGGALPLVSGWTEITSLRGWSHSADTLAPEITLTTPHAFTLLALARQVTVNS